MKSLTQAIEDYQATNKISDYRLSKLLNVSHSSISRIKTGTRKPGPKILRAISENIPSLKPYVANFIINGDEEGEKRPGRPSWKRTLERLRV